MLGGGLVPGAVVLLAGEPGVGKSTLLLDVAQQWAAGARHARPSWSAARSRSARCGCAPSGWARCTSGSTWPPRATCRAVLGHLDAVKPGLLVLDSVQTISTPGTEGVPGGVTQVRAVTAALVAVAKERGIATVLVGHVTKDGQVAGPRVLEHLVDVVLHFEGDKHSSLRLVRGVKNRFGAADEVGCFEMHEGGITSLADPSGLFLTRYAEPVPGTCVTVAMEGRRALVTEVQALIGAEVPGSPRRTVSGPRQRPAGDGAGRAGAPHQAAEALQQGGLRRDGRRHPAGRAVRRPGRWRSRSRPAGSTWRWRRTWWRSARSGLTGEIRRVGAVARRLAEAARLGFRYALVPPGCGPAATGRARQGHAGDRGRVICARRCSPRPRPRPSTAIGDSR